MNFRTRFRLGNSKNMKKLILILTAFVFSLSTFAQDIPGRPSPQRLVNDLAGVLTTEQANQLERELVDFDNRSSTQIVVVTVPTLDGYDKAEYAFRLGESWGVGQKGKDNGIVVLFKPKTAESRGEIFVAVGYGLEGVIPDATANRDIIEAEMIPRFKNGDIYGGLSAGTKVLMALASKEFTPEQYHEKVSGNGGGGAVGGLVFFIIIAIIVSLFGRRRSYYTGGSSLPFWLLMGSMMSNNHHRGSWGNFSGGSGGFSGGGGGFGGFGGGSFGGGGAGGSW